MGWSIWLREDTGAGCDIEVAQLGEIGAPVKMDEVGLSLVQAKAVLGSLQSRLVALQE